MVDFKSHCLYRLGNVSIITHGSIEVVIIHRLIACRKTQQYLHMDAVAISKLLLTSKTPASSISADTLDSNKKGMRKSILRING